MNNNFWLYVLLISFIFMSAFFSSAETAFSAANKIRLQNYSTNGNKRARTAIHILDNFDRSLSTLLIGNTIINMAISSIATILAIDILGDSGALWSTIIITVVVLTVGEILPKSIAKEYSDATSLLFAPILKIIMKILFPIVFIFLKLKDWVLKTFCAKKTNPSVTEQELKYIIDNIEKEGVLEKEEGNLVRSALEFDEKTAQDILTPRVDITALNIDDPDFKIKKTILTEGYSRIPVYKDSIDNIIGILHTRDYLEAIALNKQCSISEMITPAHYIYKTKKLSHILADFKRNKLHIAIISDDYGGTVGMLTMEDLLEQIVGDIWDEDEEIERKIIKIADNTYQISANINIHEMFDLLEMYDKSFEHGCTSLGGWVLEMMGKIPQIGDTFEYKNLKVAVSEIEDNRITKLSVTKNSQ